MLRILIAASSAAYRLVLLRFPRRLRAQYGHDMLRLFEQDVEASVRQHGMVGLVGAWGRALSDALRPLPGPVGPTRGEPARGGIMGRGTMGWLEDVGFGWRSLRREPGFTAGIVAVLGAGVALNAAVFAVVNAYLLRPLPYPDADRVVSVTSEVGVTWSDAEDVLEKRVSWDLDAFTIVGGSGPQMARGAWVTPDFLEVYGVEPALGRIFLPEEGGPGATASVAIISYGLWQQRYGGDPGVLGRTFSAFTSDRPDDAEVFTIVGVLPRDFWHFNDYTEVLAPLREDRNLYAGRLHPDVPLERAAQLLTARVLDRVAGLPEGFSVELVRTQERHVASIRPTLWTLQGAVLLVFLIVIANASVLLLVRAARRERELAVRRALGAARGRLARQLVAEGLLIAGMAGLLGVGLATLALEGLAGFESLTLWRSVPGGLSSLRLDGMVVGATVALVGLTGVAFGLIPIVSVARAGLVTSLVEGGRGRTDTRGRRLARSTMVAAELALSLALLTGAGLMIQSAINLQRADVGFEPERIVRGQAGLRQASYPQVEDRHLFFETLRERVRGLPAVESVGLVSAVPFTWNFNTRPLETVDGSQGEAAVHLADGDYFGTMGIDVLQGRVFNEDDVPGAEPVVVVSRTVARSLWPDLDPIGRRVRVVPWTMPGETPEPEPFATVVGVVEDVRKSVADAGHGDLYAAHGQSATLWMNLVMRVREGARSPVPEVEAILAELNPDVPLSTVQALDDRVASATAPSRFLAVLFGGFAGFALLLAVVGLYGVMAYAARQRRREVAIHMALGATGGAVTKMFVRQALLVLSVGLAGGVWAGRLLGDSLAGQLHGIGPHDPATFLAVAGLLTLTSLLAVWLPANRAADTEPMAILREE